MTATFNKRLLYHKQYVLSEMYRASLASPQQKKSSESLEAKTESPNSDTVDKEMLRDIRISKVNSGGYD